MKNSEKGAEMAKTLATAMLKISGGDIRTPAEVKDPMLENLGLLNTPKEVETLFGFTCGKLENMEELERLKFIKGLMVVFLRPTQLMSLHSYIIEIVEKSLEYLSEHPDLREAPTVPSLSELLGINM